MSPVEYSNFFVDAKSFLSLGLQNLRRCSVCVPYNSIFILRRNNPIQIYLNSASSSTSWRKPRKGLTLPSPRSTSCGWRAGRFTQKSSVKSDHVLMLWNDWREAQNVKSLVISLCNYHLSYPTAKEIKSIGHCIIYTLRLVFSFLSLLKQSQNWNNHRL